MTMKEANNGFYEFLCDRGHQNVQKKHARIFLEEVFEYLKREILTQPNQKLNIPGLCTIECRQVKERKCRNPKTEETFMVPAHYVPHIKMSSLFKRKFKETQLQD